MGIGSLVGAGISGAASIFGSSQQASASKKAAAIQAQSAQNAINAQQGMFNTTQNNLQPYLNTGTAASLKLGALLDDYRADTPLPDMLTQPMTQAELEATPGYAFTLGQGLKATQNSAAARGLGLSGAALKGAASYATGLSDSTYNTRWQQNMTQGQQIWQDQVANKTNSFNRLLGASQLGANAAVGLGNTSAAVGNSIGNSANLAGAASAAGINGAAAATTNGITGVANAITGGISGYNQNQLLQSLLGKQNSTVNGLFSSDGASWT
jgi:hypothetical protein